MNHAMILAYVSRNRFDRAFETSKRLFKRIERTPAGISRRGENLPDMETGGRAQHNEQPADDRDLVLAFQNGCPDAYEAIYRRHEARVRATCGRVLGHHDDAQEAVQETFLRAYQALGRFNGRYQLGAWLSRIATNVCLDQLRSQSRRNPLALIPSFTAEIADPSPEPEEIITGRDPRVHRAIEDIQPLHARALELRAIHGMSHDEMASRLSMSPAQVKALLHRARRSFRRAFAKAGNWMAAPLLGVRSLVGRTRDAQPGNDSLLLAGPAGQALAEKAVASVVLAALAFSNLSLGEDAEPPPAAERETNHGETAPVIWNPRHDPVTPGLLFSAGGKDGAGTRSGANESRSEDGDLVADVVRTVDGAAPARPPTPSDDPPEEPRPVVPGVPTTSGVDVVEQVKEAVQKLPEGGHG
jgi:RNA polymerase sigma factor (sigma-70 family)